jgi:hypothetical protein
MGWTEAADNVLSAMSNVIQNKTVTYDLERLMDGATTSLTVIVEPVFGLLNSHQGPLPITLAPNSSCAS